MLELKMFENALFCVFAENLGVVDQRFECVVQFSFDFTTTLEKLQGVLVSSWPGQK